jgi:hypothetical protein
VVHYGVERLSHLGETMMVGTAYSWSFVGYWNCLDEIDSCRISVEL